MLPLNESQLDPTVLDQLPFDIVYELRSHYRRKQQQPEVTAEKSNDKKSTSDAAANPPKTTRTRGLKMPKTPVKSKKVTDFFGRI